MGYIKCPRCELNYMPDTERFCSVCKREMRGEDDHEELCTACGERPALPGEDLCAVCLKELKRQESDGPRGDEDDTGVVGDEGEVTAMETTSELEEIDIDVDEDIPSTEYSEIHKELGMDEEEEEEEKPEELMDEEEEE